MKGGLAGLMKQAQKMKTDFEDAQEELSHLEVTGESGGGMVKVVMTGQHNVQGIEIDSIVMQEDKEMLEDLLTAAINDAVRKVEKNTRDKMTGVAGSIGLPEGIKLPF